MNISEHALIAAIDDIVAMVYVQSHHSVQEQMISLADCIAAAHRHQIPVIVDAARVGAVLLAVG